MLHATIYPQAYPKAFLLAALLAFAEYGAAAWYSDTQSAMGTEVRLELWHSDKQEAEKAITRVMAEMHRVDASFSPYKSASQLSKLNRWAADNKKYAKPKKISTELFQLLKMAKMISELSEGAFDVTFASVGNYYDFRNSVKPSGAEIKRALPAINYQHIKLDADTRTVSFARKGVRIDLGGIAKGHAVDRAIALLQKQGIEHAMVAAGGDSRIIGDRRGRPWLTGIQDPRADDDSADDDSADVEVAGVKTGDVMNAAPDKKSAAGMAVLIPLQDTAVSTSGDYERFFIEDGKRYHHILNPRTGDSARKVRSVTILGEDALTTDALSTTVFVLGVKKGLALVNRLPGIDAIIIDGDGQLRYSNELEQPE